MTRQHWLLMLADVNVRAPLEACGLLAGQRAGAVYQARLVIPTTNLLQSPARYQIDPREQLAAFEQMEADGFDLVGIYHSHPQGPSTPSATDLAEAYYPDAVYLVWSKTGEEWTCNGFTMLAGQFNHVEVAVA